MAHNLIRWVASLGMRQHGPVVTHTIRRHLLTLPGRVTSSARRAHLHLPTNWRWAEDFSNTLIRLRGIAQPG